jgi:hypothetical protein
LEADHFVVSCLPPMLQQQNFFPLQLYQLKLLNPARTSRAMAKTTSKRKSESKLPLLHLEIHFAIYSRPKGTISDAFQAHWQSAKASRERRLLEMNLIQQAKMIPVTSSLSMTSPSRPDT